MKFLIAITFSDENLISSVLESLCTIWGAVERKSGRFAFDYTRYYETEMGTGLSKQFFSFKNPEDCEKLVDLKLQSMSIEKLLSVQNKRRVNIDPSYIELPKLVVASSKNFAHRICIGQGVFGDVQLQYTGGHFVACEWTYPDYKMSNNLYFFETVRADYFKQLKKL